MKNMKLILLLLYFVGQLNAETGDLESGANSLANPVKTSQFDGPWVGKISSPNHFKPGADLVFKDEIIILLDGDTAKVYNKSGEDFVDYGYQFKVDRQGTNVHLYSNEAEAAWVETIAYTLTLESENRLMVAWSRVVNNHDLPSTSKQARAYFVGVSFFERYTN